MSYAAPALIQKKGKVTGAGSQSSAAFRHAAAHPASQSARHDCAAPAMLRSFHAWAEDAAWSTLESRGTACSPG
jgi:hypothetical protein